MRSLKKEKKEKNVNNLIMKKILILLVGFLLLSFTIAEEDKKRNDLPLNKRNLWKVINDLEIKFPEIAFAQALLESGDFKSDLARNNNNLFGMKKPSKRSTTADEKTRRGYAVYDHWIESIKDYKLYQEFVIERNKIANKYQYVSYIDRTYAEINDYSKRLNRVIKEHKFIINSYE